MRATLCGWLMMWVFTVAPAMAQSQWSEGVARAGDIEISYATAGPATGEAVLLLMGTGGQLVDWPPPLLDGLVEKGYRVVIYDHRDAGLSTHLDGAGRPDWVAVFGALAAGERPRVPYTLEDLTADALALLDGLSIPEAHLLGMSMGAAVAMELAASHPDRVRSITTIGGSTGNPAIPIPADPARLGRVPALPGASDTVGAVQRQLALWKALSGSAWAMDPDVMRQRVVASVRRSWNPAGVERQGAAMLAAGDRRARVRTIRAPTTVVHGAEDPLVSVAAAHELASLLVDAELEVIDGLGHDLPDPVVPALLRAFTTAAEAAIPSDAR